MPVYPVNKNNIDILINENEIAVIDFWAEWCGPCKSFAPVYERVADRFPTLKFAKINIEEEPELAELFHVRSIPHLVIMKEGIAIYSDSGSMSESALRELITQAIDADVTELKKQIEGGEEGKTS